MLIKWTEDEVEFLKYNYPLKGLKFCVENIKSHTKSSIISKAYELKLKVNPNIRRNKPIIDIPDGYLYCGSCKSVLLKDNFNLKRKSSQTCKKCLIRLSRNYYLKMKHKRVEKIMYYGAKSRAKKLGIPFNIKISDITIPKYCPVLGIELIAYRNKGEAPSIDRFIPEKGYVKGNISIISYRANKLKNDANIDELEKLVNWMKNKNQELSSTSGIPLSAQDDS